MPPHLLCPFYLLLQYQNTIQPPEVVKILFDSKVKLVKYLEGENSDEQYRDDKQLVISTLEGLEV